jgi:hypothetical protein
LCHYNKILFSFPALLIIAVNIPYILTAYYFLDRFLHTRTPTAFFGYLFKVWFGSGASRVSGVRAGAWKGEFS